MGRVWYYLGVCGGTSEDDAEEMGQAESAHLSQSSGGFDFTESRKLDAFRGRDVSALRAFIAVQ